MAVTPWSFLAGAPNAKVVSVIGDFNNTADAADRQAPERMLKEQQCFEPLVGTVFDLSNRVNEFRRCAFLREGIRLNRGVNPRMRYVSLLPH
jgi:hypothetical protein